MIKKTETTEPEYSLFFIFNMNYPIADLIPWHVLLAVVLTFCKMLGRSLCICSFIFLHDQTYFWTPPTLATKLYEYSASKLFIALIITHMIEYVNIWKTE